MISALHHAGALAEQVTGPMGHAVWIPTYATPRVYEWLLNNRGQTRAEGQTWPEEKGFHRLAWSPAKDPTRKVDYIIHLPADIHPDSNVKRPCCSTSRTLLSLASSVMALWYTVPLSTCGHCRL